MAQSLTTGAVFVTNEVTTVPVSGTLSSLAGSVSGAGSTTLGTVGAGKVWKILNATLQVNTTGNLSTTDLDFNGVPHLRVYGQSSTNENSGSLSQRWNYGACPTLAAGETVVVEMSQTGWAAATIQYIEEST